MRFGKKVEHNGIVYDSGWERDYHLLLMQDPNVKQITLQPSFMVIKPYKVICRRCVGSKKIPSPKTGKPVKCSLCKGTGFKEKQGAGYTADFMVEYQDGTTEIIDVKTSGPVSRDFPLRRKLFEMQTGRELVVMTKKKGEWVRK